MMSQNPEYKYKYPKLSKAQTIKHEWETEQGVPNKLNQLLRAEESGNSIEDIKALDDAYAEGLNQLYSDIDKEAEEIKNKHKTIDEDTILSDAQML